MYGSGRHIKNVDPTKPVDCDVVDRPDDEIIGTVFKPYGVNPSCSLKSRDQGRHRYVRRPLSDARKQRGVWMNCEIRLVGVDGDLLTQERR